MEIRDKISKKENTKKYQECISCWKKWHTYLACKENDFWYGNEKICIQCWDTKPNKDFKRDYLFCDNCIVDNDLWLPWLYTKKELWTKK